MAAAPVLSVRDLEVTFGEGNERWRVVQRVSFDVPSGKTLGIVGESGCGKSMTLRALSDLVPTTGTVAGGRICVDGREIPRAELAGMRGTEIAMIFQDPGACLSPVITVGAHLEEVLRLKRGMRRREARADAVQLLDHVGIANPASRVRAYPHELSGGMRQRVMIALAIAARPRILLADEPTTALDVTTQEQILELLLTLQGELGMAIVLVTHDIGVVDDVCDEVAVMYAGYVVERGSCASVLGSPRHPYTQRLLSAVPSLRGSALPLAIPGSPPDLASLPRGCPFRPRCSLVRPECEEVAMEVESGKRCACPYSEDGLQNRL